MVNSITLIIPGQLAQLLVFSQKDEVLSPEQKESSRYPHTSSSTIIKPKLYSYYYFDAETGAAVTNQFVNWKGNWYYFGNDGKALPLRSSRQWSTPLL